jgi:hypothetical protein
MNERKLPPQLIRLVILTVAILGLYGLARFFLTPPSFGELGFYRALALEEATLRSPVFAGQKACDECHSDTIKKVAKAEHKTVSCESCHGPGRAHVENPEVKMGAIFCVRCHGVDPARSAWIKQVDPKKHYAGQRCAECHVPHQPSEVP